MVNRRQVKEYKKWLAQTLQKQNLTTQELVRILDGQLQLPERLMDGELIRMCRLMLYPKICGDVVPGKQETLERVRSILRRENCSKEEGDNGSACEKKHFRLHPAAFVACVLVIVLLFGVTINAVGFNVWRMIFRWDDETMEMKIAMQSHIKGHKDYLDQSYDDAFYRKLAEMEMAPLLPSWMPDGFVLDSVENNIETDYLLWVVGNYACGDRQLQISVYQDDSENSGGIWNLEKDEREPDVYEKGGVKFYIMDNLERSRAFWYDPPYTINIIGHVSREELKQMVSSVFERSRSK